MDFLPQLVKLAYDYGAPLVGCVAMSLYIVKLHKSHVESTKTYANSMEKLVEQSARAVTACTMELSRLREDVHELKR